MTSPRSLVSPVGHRIVVPVGIEAARLFAERDETGTERTVVRRLGEGQAEGELLHLVVGVSMHAFDGPLNRALASAPGRSIRSPARPTVLASSATSRKKSGLTAQFVRDHRRRGRERGGDGHALAAALQCGDQRREIAIAREQHEMVEERRHLERIDRQLDVHAALDLAASGAVGEFLAGLVTTVKPL